VQVATGALRVDALLEPGDVVVVKQSPARGHALGAQPERLAAPVAREHVPRNAEQPAKLAAAGRLVGAGRSDGGVEDLRGQVRH
jgi:hypothetical protein